MKNLLDYTPAEFGELTPENVTRLFGSCLFREDEGVPEGLIPTQGVKITMSFHPGRLREHEKEIRACLDKFAPEFKETGGRGMTFSVAHYRRAPGMFIDEPEGEKWGDLMVADMIVTLGIAIGKVKWLAPREMWGELPKGFPYLVILAEPGDVVPPPIPIDDPVQRVVTGLVPWVIDQPRKIISHGKKIIRAAFRKGPTHGQN